ncbi:MAG: lytic transglycosylase domain-containing protein [Bacteroidales bacterium]|jgi:membrane-bound lytic murein transglycosylase D|nr:lytic transglycosylase domain-containing protein [Bacteroidales bacterium]
MKNKYTLFTLIGLIVAFIVFINSQSNIKSADTYYQQALQKTYSVFSLALPTKLSFADEVVPMDNFDVRESIDQELLVNTYWQSQTILFIKRANKYFPEIEAILKEKGIPDDFKYLVLAESGLKNAVSPSGAVGVWQLLDGTAKDYGLEVNSEVDERYHLKKSTEAACDYIKDAQELFGTWTMAAAAYNVGRKGLMQQVNRQKEDNYYNLLLNNETGRYIYRILAIKLILENPDQFGFHVREKDMYALVPTYEVKVDSSVKDFADFAKKHAINYKLLKYFNPWLRDSYLTNKYQKEYYVRIPKEGYRSYSKIIGFYENDSTAVTD